MHLQESLLEDIICGRCRTEEPRQESVQFPLVTVDQSLQGPGIPSQVVAQQGLVASSILGSWRGHQSEGTRPCPRLPGQERSQIRQHLPEKVGSAKS